MEVYLEPAALQHILEAIAHEQEPLPEVWQETVGQRIGLSLLAVEASVWQWQNHVRCVQKGVRDLEYHGFPLVEVSAFKAGMESELGRLVEAGRRVFEQYQSVRSLVFCGDRHGCAQAFGAGASSATFFV